MEAELVPVATVPLGMVSSTLLHGSRTRGQHAEAPAAAAMVNEVLVSLCPSGKVMAFISSFKTQFVACEGLVKVDGSQGVTYQTSYEGLLHVVRDPSKPRPSATAVIVVPIAFETRAGTSSIIVVGFTDGCIRAYSKSGTSVFSQSLHSEPVVRMTCMAPAPGQKWMAANENLVVMFKTAVCIIEGRSLVEVVRANVTRKTEEELPYLSYKKWHLQEQTSIMDVILLAQWTPSAFDHLCEASVAGFDTIIRGGPSPEARLITVGAHPMIALYRITKDAGTPNMSELMSAVASKMTSAVLGKLSQAGGWLGWGGAKAPKPKSPEERIQVAINIPMDTNVPDERRTVYSIVVSPLGNLAAAVDCFGRVLLLDTESLVVRRMWKGYREAQCGWLLVHDAAFQSPSTRKARPKPPAIGANRAQCLCIYAARRGIVELWPVQSGSRIAAFQVGKGCRLLYSPHGVFTSSSHLEEGRAKSRGVRDSAVLLCPNGQVVTFSVPFPALVRLHDIASHDAHLLNKLPQALQSGDTDLVLEIFSSLKSSRSMKQAISTLVGHHPLPDVPPEFTIKVLNLVLSRLHPTESSQMGLLHFVAGVRQVTQLMFALGDLSNETTSPPSSNKLHEVLSQYCGVPQELAKNLASILKDYFQHFTPQKKVLMKMEVKDVVHCLSLPEKVGNFILGTEVSESGMPSKAVQLNLKTDLSASTLYDIGCTLFLHFISSNLAEHEVRDVFCDCGIPSSALLSLLCRVVLVGTSQESNPCILLQHLQRVTSAIARTNSGWEEGAVEGDRWLGVCLQCAHSSNVGHALLAALLWQKMASQEEADTQEGEEDITEAWETVTEEREKWVRLVHHLESLTLLSNAVGQKAMRTLPPIPYTVCEEGEEEDEGGLVDVGDLHVHLLHKGEKGGVSAALLEATGPALIAHCVSRWLVKNKIPANFVALMPSDPHKVQDEAHTKVVFLLGPLLKLLPHSLSHSSLLVHCTWQAAYLWREDPKKDHHLYSLVLQYISHIPSVQLLKGSASFLWCYLFEKSFVRVLDLLRRGAITDPGTPEFVCVCRNLFSYLYQISHVDYSLEDQPSTSTPVDVLLLPQPPGKQFLMDLVQAFPALNPTLLKTYFELLLHTEIALQLRTAVNIVAFYPTWVRTALKKSVFRVSQVQEQIPLQLQQKRTKFLCDAVDVHVTTGPRMLPTVNAIALESPTSTTPLPQLEVVEFSDFIFLLAQLWGLDIDSIKQHWVCNLFAAGLGEHGRDVFLGVRDKSRVSRELLSLAGCLADHLIQRIENKPERLTLIAQIPPTLLEWLRNQSTSKSKMKMEATWKSLSQLLELVQPYLPKALPAGSIAQDLNQIVQLRTSQGFT